MNIRSVAVFCGSHTGMNPLFEKHAAELGKWIAELGLTLVYGGGRRGLMGAVANAALANGGKVSGIIPELLIAWEAQHEQLSQLSVVPDMHTRKKMLFDQAEAVVILPGGFGTMDEMFEILTWNQLKIHDKKIYVLNTAGFYNHLIEHINQMQQEGFLYESAGERIVFCESPAEIFMRMDRAAPDLDTEG